MKPLDHSQYRELGEWAENKIVLDSVFKSKMLFSNDAQFWLSGYGDMLSHKPRT